MEFCESCVVLNRGASLREAQPDVGRGVLLTGNPRGGTTFIASVAHHLGIPLGKSRPRYEDRRLRQLLLGEVPDEGHARLEATIRSRESQHALWGWKMPAITKNFDLVDGLVQRPIYVMIFRDPLSIAMRRAQSGNSKLANHLRNAMDVARQMVDFVAKTDRECILVSFDKAARKPESFVRALADVTGITVTDERVAEIVAAVRADSLLYEWKTQPSPE